MDSCILNAIRIVNPRLRSNAIAVLVISAVALCIVLPFLKLGIPSGHDFEFHLNSWIEVVDHWKQRNFYPQWDALAHYGYGEARFIFYPPFSWTLGAALGTILPWKLVPAAYIWIVLTLAGCSMFLLARRWLPYADAIFAAALYLANPYNLVIVYWRSAFAELMAAIYLPLLLFLVFRIGETRGRRVLVPLSLSLVMAAGWLTNLPSAVMMNYSLILLAIAVAFSRKSLVVIGYAAAAAVLGAMLAGFYLVPAYHEQSWVNIGQVLAPGVRPSDNFLFTYTEDADHNHFNLLVSIVAVWQIALAAAALMFWRRFKRHSLWPFAVVWATFCVVLMLRPTLGLWDHLPELRFVQFPWRWLLCLSVPFALAISFVIRRWWLRGLVCALSLAMVFVVWQRVQVPWWDTAADIQEMLDNQHDGIGNEGTDEYVPAGADPYALVKDASAVHYDGGGTAQIQIQEWRAETRKFTVIASAPGKLILRLFNYPLWKTTVNGKQVGTGSTSQTRQMIVPVNKGESRVEITFVKGEDRTLGLVCSFLAVAALAAWSFSLRRSFAPSAL